jgi:hypothetical protein
MKKGQKIEEKYNPETVIMNTWRRFSNLEEYKGSEAHNFQVYIEIQPREDDMYIIGGYKSDCFLLKYSIRHSSSTITAPQNLFKDKDFLGKVSMRFKEKEIKNYQSYDEFWEDIRQK